MAFYIFKTPSLKSPSIYVNILKLFSSEDKNCLLFFQWCEDINKLHNKEKFAY